MFYFPLEFFSRHLFLLLTYCFIFLHWFWPTIVDLSSFHALISQTTCQILFISSLDLKWPVDKTKALVPGSSLSPILFLSLLVLLNHWMFFLFAGLFRWPQCLNQKLKCVIWQGTCMFPDLYIDLFTCLINGDKLCLRYSFQFNDSLFPVYWIRAHVVMDICRSIKVTLACPHGLSALMLSLLVLCHAWAQNTCAAVCGPLCCSNSLSGIWPPPRPAPVALLGIRK